MKKKSSNTLLAQVLLAISQVLFPLLVYPTVTQSLGAQGLGKVSFADSLVQAIAVLASFGIPLYGIRETAIRKNNSMAQMQLFWELFFLQSALLVPAVLVLWLLGWASAIKPGLLILGTVALLGNSLMCDWFLQGNERFSFLALRSVAIRFVTTLLILMLVKDRDDYLLYYAILCSGVVVTMLLNFTVITAASPRPQAFSSWRVYLKNSNWLLYGCYVLASLYALLDLLLLGWLSTDEAVGYYSFGYRIIRMSSMVIPTLGVVFIPKIAFHYAADNKQEVQKQVYDSQQLIFFFGIPLSVAFFVLAPEIVHVFASGYFQPAILVIRILSPVPLLASLSHLTGSQILLPIKKEKVFLLFLTAGCLLNILIDLLLIPLFKEKAAATANLGVESFVAVGTCWYLRNQNLLRIAKKEFVYCLAASFLLFPVVYVLRLLHVSSFAVLLLALAVTGPIYLFTYLQAFPDTVVRKIISFQKPT